MSSQYTMQSVACFEQRIQLTGGIHQIKNVTYILSRGFVEGSPFPPFYEKAKTKGWKTLTMNCGHFAMLDEPEELTTILLSGR